MQWRNANVTWTDYERRHSLIKHRTFTAIVSWRCRADTSTHWIRPLFFPSPVSVRQPPADHYIPADGMGHARIQQPEEGSAMSAETGTIEVNFQSDTGCVFLIVYSE
jgi:hypothetical protein